VGDSDGCAGVCFAQPRHKSMDTLRGYVRDAEIFKDHAGKGLL
jgi:hypothetical protein